MAQPPPPARFNMLQATELESRDGGLTKGGLVRNGFVEKDADGELWMWQRPALGTRLSAAPLTAGLGIYFVGTVLWGAYHGTSGTATSQTI